MNTKRLKLLTIGLIITIIFSILFYFAYSLIKQKVNEAEISQIKIFSENFIKDYSTYKVSKPDEYNKKISEYILPTYKDEFLAKYELGPVKSVEKVNMGNSSDYLSSEISINKIKNSTDYDVVIRYEAKILDASWSEKPFTETTTVEITVVKNKGSYYINNLGFINN